MGPLRIAATFTIPIREVSGLALRFDGVRTELLAVGDATAELARAELDDGRPGRWHVRRIDGLDDHHGSQLEAVAVDTEGRVLLLRETPPAILRLDAGDERLERELMGDTAADPGWRAIRGHDENSLGEGMAMTPDGELVLAKEKRPSALLVVRVVGGAVVLERHWLLAPDLHARLADVSDLAFGPDGRLYLLSDQSSVVVRASQEWRAADTLTADAVWPLPNGIDKAEGLAVLPDGRPLVAVDRKKAKDNLFLLEPPLT